MYHEENNIGMSFQYIDRKPVHTWRKIISLDAKTAETDSLHQKISFFLNPVINYHNKSIILHKVGTFQLFSL